MSATICLIPAANIKPPISYLELYRRDYPYVIRYINGEYERIRHRPHALQRLRTLRKERHTGKHFTLWLHGERIK